MQKQNTKSKKPRKTRTTKPKRARVSKIDDDAQKKKIAASVEEAEKEQLRRLEANPELGSVTQVHFKKCKFMKCNRLVDEQGFPPYCSQACAAFDRRRILSLDKTQNTYKPEYATDYLWAYIRSCEVSNAIRYAKVGDTLVPIKNIQLPSIDGYGLFLGLPSVTLKYWSTVHPEFREALLFIKQFQKVSVVERSLSGQYNPVIAKLMLMNNHGMKDRSEKTVNNTFGIVREAYEKADTFDPTMALEGDGDDEDDVTS